MTIVSRIISFASEAFALGEAGLGLNPDPRSLVTTSSSKPAALLRLLPKLSCLSVLRTCHEESRYSKVALYSSSFILASSNKASDYSEGSTNRMACVSQT